MKSEQELAEFYERLKKELVETSLFPTKYLYKFIIPSDFIVFSLLLSEMAKVRNNFEF